MGKHSRIPAWLRAGIEDDLRNYPLTKIALRERREEVLGAKAPAPVGKSTSPSDPTFGVVSRLCSADIIRMEWTCRAIEDVHRVSSPGMKKVMELAYWKRLRTDEAAYNPGMSLTTLWRLNTQIVENVAYRMGTMRPTETWWREKKRGKPKMRVSRAKAETNIQHAGQLSLLS